MVAARAVWQAEDAAGIGGIAPDRLVVLDEGGVLTTMARLWGRSPRGQRAVATAPFGHGQRLTILGALGTAGMMAARSIEAAPHGAVFLADLERVLLPELRRTKPDAGLVLDNLRAHKTAAVRRRLDRAGFLDRDLPPSSPDLSPIEPAWAKLKAELRRVAARTAEALHQAIGPALNTITAQAAAGFFRHAGDGRPN